MSPPPAEPPPPESPVQRTPEERSSAETREPIEPAASAAQPVAPSVALPVVAQPVAADQPHVTYVPLAVTIGDGFKFGCGFFLALVLAGLVGFVLLAALFVLTGLFGLNLPLTR